MAKRRIFEVDFMESDNFCECTQAQKLLYIYLCLNADDEGFTSSTMTARFLAGADDQDVQALIYSDLIYRFESGVVCIKHWFVHNLKNEKMAHTKFIKERELLEIINNVYQFTGSSKKDAELSKNFQEKERISEKNTSQSNLIQYKSSEINKEEVKEENGQQVSTPTPEKTTRFIPPSQQDVENYIAEHGYHVDAERFILFYSSKGWMVGKNKMKDWKAAVQTWEKSWKADHPNGTATQTKKPEKESNSSFDMDEFFELAVANSRRKVGSQ